MSSLRKNLLSTTLSQVSGDETTVIQAVLACDTERSQLLQEEQTLLRQLNKGAPDGAQPSQPATANGHPVTATANGNGKADLPNGTTAAETRDSSGATGGKESASKAADVAESKAAAQLAQVSLLVSKAFVIQCPLL